MVAIYRLLTEDQIENDWNLDNWNEKWWNLEREFYILTKKNKNVLTLRNKIGKIKATACKS